MIRDPNIIDEFQQLSSSVQGLVNEIRMRDPERMELYEERYTYVRNGILNARKFVAICRLAQQCNALLKDSPLRFPLPTEVVLRNPSSHAAFYNKMVRAARSFPRDNNLDTVMPMSDATYMYNPDDFLVYLQLLIQQLGGELPSRFLPPDLSGVLLPLGFSVEEGRRMIRQHSLELLGPSADDTAVEGTETAAQTYFDRVLVDLVRHAGLDDPESGQSSLYGRMPFLQHVTLSLFGELRERYTRILGEEVARFYHVTDPASEILGPARDLMRESIDTGRPLLGMLEAAAGEVRGAVLFVAAHVVCERIAKSAVLGLLDSDRDLSRSISRAPGPLRSTDDIEGYFTAQQLEVVRLTGIRSMLERAWPIMDSTQRRKLRAALTVSGAEEAAPPVTDKDFEEQRRLALAKAAREQEIKLRRELEDLEKQEKEEGGGRYLPRASAFLVPLPDLVFEDRL